MVCPCLIVPILAAGAIGASGGASKAGNDKKNKFMGVKKDVWLKIIIILSILSIIFYIYYKNKDYNTRNIYKKCSSCF